MHNERLSNIVHDAKTRLEREIEEEVMSMLKNSGVTVSERFEGSLRIRVEIKVHPI